jgi:prepilin peptidase CpaA
MVAAPSTALIGLVLGACIFAAASDAVSRRIPNLIPLVILTAVVIERAHQGWTSLGSGLGAMAIVLILGTIAHAHGWFGGGDVKLAAAVAAAFALPTCFAFLLLTGVCGGVVALVTLFVTRRLTVREALVTLDVLVRNRIVTLPDKKATVPYAIAIAFGALLTTVSLSSPVMHLL